jgi:hypothetical protein
MKRLLLTSILLIGCPLPDGPQKPLTPVPTATPTIGTPPVVVDRCAPHAPLKSCKSATFGDGKGGTLFKRSDTNPKNFAFILSGNIRTFESVEVCTPKKCEKLPFVGCANPSGDMLRGHYKGPLSLNQKANWRVKFGECELKIENKERND